MILEEEKKRAILEAVQNGWWDYKGFHSYDDEDDEYYDEE